MYVVVLNKNQKKIIGDVHEKRRNNSKFPVIYMGDDGNGREDFMFTEYKYWQPYVSPFDPCPPIRVKSYNTPPQLYLGFQPRGLPQFSTAKEALFHGTLWPALFSPYPDPQIRGEEDE